LRPVEQTLRVDTAGVQAMATRWSASVGDLNEAVAPTGLGLSCRQPHVKTRSAFAVASRSERHDGRRGAG
ncbi:MAG: hypothetical protein WBS15_08655, partial [Mycobacterium sp.]